MTKNLKSLLIILIFASTFLIGYAYWQHQKLFPQTDDAQVQGHIIQMSAQVGGPITAIHIKDQQFVKKGEPLLDIDPQPFKQILKQTQAQFDQVKQAIKSHEATIKSNEATVNEQRTLLHLTQKNANRILQLVKERLLPQAKADEINEQLATVEAALAVANQQLKSTKMALGSTGPDNPQYRSALATLKRAQLNLAHTHIVAPTDGYISQFNLRVGSNIVPNTPLFAIIENKSWWIIANFKETQLDRIKINQPATIQLDMYPGHRFKGWVESIGLGTDAAFSLLPSENATGNWVKITQRFPVRIRLHSHDPNYPLRVGASCTVTIDTR